MEAINILVRSGQYCRQFTTKTFSIRNLVTQIRRYNPAVEILCLWYGDLKPYFLSNEEWKKFPSQWRVPNAIYIPTDNNKEHLLENYDYRTAVNLAYARCLNVGTYPKLHPFKNVKRDGNLPAELSKYENVHYPLFITDEQNPYTTKEDILLHLDGYRIERKVNGYDIEGYLIENKRYNSQEDDRA